MTSEATLDRTDTNRRVIRPDVASHMRKGRIWAWVRRALLLVAAGFVVRTTVVGWPEIRHAFQTLSDGAAGLVLVAIALECLWVFTLAQVYRSSLIGFGGSATMSGALRVSMGAFTLSRVLPGGGAVGALFAAREFIRAGNRAEVTLIALVSAGWVSLTALTLLLLLGIAVGVVVSGSLTAKYLILPAAVLGVLAATGLLATLAARRLTWRGRVAGGLERVFSGWGAGMSRVDIESALYDRGRRGVGGLARVFGWSAISWALDAAALGVMFAAFGHPLDVGVLTVGYGVANLIQALPELTPGWLGVIEGSLSLTYAGLGVPAGVAVVVILAYRSISFWMPVAAGLPHAWGIIRANRQASSVKEHI
jgi:uncharacterized membrane protein YbhN (UPF0104 family)